MFSKTKRTKTETELLDGLLAGGRAGDSALETIYWAYFPLIKQFILNAKGSEEEAEDIFQDAVISFYEQVKAGKFRKESSIKTYLYTLCRNMWFNKLKRKTVATNFVEYQKENYSPSPSPMDELLGEEKQMLILNLLDKLGEKCRQILEYTLYHRLSMTEISEKMGFLNEQNARNKNYKCKQELKRLALADPLIKSIIPSIK